MTETAVQTGIIWRLTQDIRLKRSMLIALIASFSVSALVGIAFVALGEFGEVQFKIIATTISFGWFSLLGLCGAIWFDRRHNLALGYSTIAASGLALLTYLSFIWEIFKPDSFDAFRIPVTFSIVAMVLAHACLMMLSQGSHPTVDIGVYATIGIASLLGTILIFLIWANDMMSEGFARFIGVLAILGVLGTIVTPLAKKTMALQSGAKG